jgi:VWFA-related protein
MRSKLVLVLCLLLATIVPSVAAQEKSADEVIKIDTALVSVPVIVSDRQGRYVPGLETKDFTVYQDGAPQRIDFFAATEEPLTVALLIDTSRSTQDVLGDIEGAARDFVRLLQPRDRATIVSFDFETHILSPLTSDHEQLNRAIKSADIGEYVGTTLRDAVYDTVNKSFAGIKGRKAIILLTDGKDAGSDVSSAALFYSLQESDTLCYSVLFQTGGRRQPLFDRDQFPFPGMGRRGGIYGGRFPGEGGRFPGGRDNPRRRERIEQRNEAAKEFLEKLSETTAGRFYSSEVKNLKKTFAEIVDELRFQYRLGFYPPDAKDTNILHEIKVKVSRPDAVVRARTSYRVKN